MPQFGRLATEQIVKMYRDEGMSLRQIAEQFKRSHTLVRSVLLEQGVELRSRGIQKGSNGSRLDHTRPIKFSLSRKLRDRLEKISQGMGKNPSEVSKQVLLDWLNNN